MPTLQSRIVYNAVAIDLYILYNPHSKSFDPIKVNTWISMANYFTPHSSFDLLVQAKPHKVNTSHDICGYSFWPASQTTRPQNESPSVGNINLQVDWQPVYHVHHKPLPQVNVRLSKHRTCFSYVLMTWPVLLLPTEPTNQPLFLYFGVGIIGEQQ